MNREIITLYGLTTSQIRGRTRRTNTPAYCFFRSEGTEQDIPLIFRIRCPYYGSLPCWCDWAKPRIKKGSYLAVRGYYSPSEKERPSFTAFSYQLISNHCDYCRCQRLSHESLCPYFIAEKIKRPRPSEQFSLTIN